MTLEPHIPHTLVLLLPHLASPPLLECRSLAQFTGYANSLRADICSKDCPSRKDCAAPKLRLGPNSTAHLVNWLAVRAGSQMVDTSPYFAVAQEKDSFLCNTEVHRVGNPTEPCVRIFPTATACVAPTQCWLEQVCRSRQSVESPRPRYCLA